VHSVFLYDDVVLIWWSLLNISPYVQKIIRFKTRWQTFPFLRLWALTVVGEDCYLLGCDTVSQVCVLWLLWHANVLIYTHCSRLKENVFYGLPILKEKLLVSSFSIVSLTIQEHAWSVSSRLVYIFTAWYIFLCYTKKEVLSFFFYFCVMCFL
jgi:hypothetical protein